MTVKIKNPVAKNMYKTSRPETHKDKKKQDKKYWARQKLSSLAPLI